MLVSIEGLPRARPSWLYSADMLSVIIPIYNEVENVEPLHAELCEVLGGIGRPFEVVYVDDGSRDGSFELLRKIAEADPRVQVIQFRRNFGQTAALAAGIDAAEGDILIFMDGDRQNDPHSIPAMLERMDEGYDVVSGWRKDRQDAELSRKLPSRLANKLISVVSGVPLHDYGCTLKAYRREVIQDVRLYGEMHRFIPAYAAWYGARITEMPVGHRARVAGRSKYGISRTLKVILDLLTVKFLSDYSTKPIYLFGGLGFSCWVTGGLAILLTLYQLFLEDVKVHRNPVFLIAVFFLLSGLVLISMGLLAELITRTYHEAQQKSIYAVRTRIRGGKVLQPSRNGRPQLKPELPKDSEESSVDEPEKPRDEAA
jgi:glycosyltransferase involved in cell wall biosynthesis